MMVKDDAGHDRPAWRYNDNRGVPCIGYVEHTIDKGGTDVSYYFRCAATGALTVRSNLAYTSDAQRIWGDTSDD